VLESDGVDASDEASDDASDGVDASGDATSGELLLPQATAPTVRTSARKERFMARPYQRPVCA
jgi:hypothetical protein